MSRPIIVAREYMMRLVGTHYQWGGDNPLEGLDCSGAVIEVLTAVGVWRGGDTTSQGLYDHFMKSGKIVPLAAQSGALRILDLLFFGTGPKGIGHVAIHYGQGLMWEAGGGGSKTKSKEDAAAQGAFVRIRPIDRRRDLVAILRP